MTDKIQKIREKIEKRYECWKEKESNSHSIESEIRMSECQHLLLMLDSLKEEPVSKDLEEAADKALSNVISTHEIVNIGSCLEMFRFGANWQKTKDESTTKDLGEYINELSKQFSEVSFAKLSRIAVRVAKWQKEHMMAKAIDAHCFGFQGAALFSFRLPASNYLVGSEVKIIVINKQ